MLGFISPESAKLLHDVGLQTSISRFFGIDSVYSLMLNKVLVLDNDTIVSITNFTVRYTHGERRYTTRPIALGSYGDLVSVLLEDGSSIALEDDEILDSVEVYMQRWEEPISNSISWCKYTGNSARSRALRVSPQ
jgi:hypothetical protein